MFLFHVSELIWEIFPLLVLFLIFLYGYTLAYYDFKPKPATKDDEFSIRAKPSSPYSDSLANTRKFTDAELGLKDLNSKIPRDYNTKRDNQITEMIRSLSADSPDAAADMIRSWLKDQ